MRSAGAGKGTAALRLQGVSRRYGYRWALRRIDLDVPRGTALGVVGPNGAGKTTLLKIAATVLRPSRGTVEVLGMNALDRTREVRRRVGLLSHESYLYEELTATENLRFAADMHAMSDVPARVESALRAVGLVRDADRFVRTFSSGMKRRLALARATIHRPELVLLDEPYGALDADGMAWVDRLIEAVRDSGGTVVVATHHVDRVLPLCRRVLWLSGGSARYLGAPSDLPGSSREVTGAGEGP